MSILPEIAPDTTKRIVLAYGSGPLAGLHQIVGTVDQLQQKLEVTSLPSSLESVTFLTHVAPVSLAKVEKRYVVYREVVQPPQPSQPQA